MNKPTIATMLSIAARKQKLTYLNDKYIQAIYIVQNELKHEVIHEKEIQPEENTSSNLFSIDQIYSLTQPLMIYRLLELNNYVYLKTSSKWVKVTEPTQLEMSL